MPEIAAANTKALKAGYFYGETTESFAVRYEVPEAQIQSGTYRKITGNEALAMAMAVAARISDQTVFFGGYPITPASDILHELSKFKHFGVRTFQAEDEIAAVCSAIGASYAGAIGATSSSGLGCPTR